MDRREHQDGVQGHGQSGGRLPQANPQQGRRLEAASRKPARADEIRSLLAHCGPAIQELVTFALYTGRRFAEIVGMRWRDVDLENGYVYFPKTKKKEPDQVALPPRARGEHVFCREDGGPRKDIRRVFLWAMRLAGIEGFRFHDLRHTAVSYMMMNGIDLKTNRGTGGPHHGRDGGQALRPPLPGPQARGRAGLRGGHGTAWEQRRAGRTRWRTAREWTLFGHFRPSGP